MRSVFRLECYWMFSIWNSSKRLDFVPQYDCFAHIDRILSLILGWKWFRNLEAIIRVFIIIFVFRDLTYLLLNESSEKFSLKREIHLIDKCCYSIYSFKILGLWVLYTPMWWLSTNNYLLTKFIIIYWIFCTQCDFEAHQLFHLHKFIFIFARQHIKPNLRVNTQSRRNRFQLGV